MGQELLIPVSQSGDLPYDNSKEEASTLHCEAEGEFWVKMKEWAWLMGLSLAQPPPPVLPLESRLLRRCAPWDLFYVCWEF